MTTITESTKITSTLKNYIAVGAILILMGMAYADLITRTNANAKDIIVLKLEIEKNRQERIKQIDDLRLENQQQHATLSSGQDRIVNILLNRGR